MSRFERLLKALTLGLWMRICLDSILRWGFYGTLGGVVAATVYKTMGGYDIFKSVFEGGKWSEPENIGSG